MARRMGGADKVKRQHDGGRLTVRERIDGMLDPDSFFEIGSVPGAATYDEAGKLLDLLPANCVPGRGPVDRRPGVIAGDAFPGRGGSADATTPENTPVAESPENP